MSIEHYFTKNPASRMRTDKIVVGLRSRDYTFITSSGVFASGKLDRGTELLIQSLELDKKRDLLDLGCGYGAIGIACANRVRTVTMSDVNQRAVRLAKWNIKLNEIKNARALQSDGFSRLGKKKFDIITLNPPTHAGKKVVLDLVKESFDHLKKDGQFYFVCKTKLGAKSYGEKIEEIYGFCKLIKRGSGYRVFRAERSLNV